VVVVPVVVDMEDMALQADPLPPAGRAEEDRETLQRDDMLEMYQSSHRDATHHLPQAGKTSPAPEALIGMVADRAFEVHAYINK
jgi:hypothetical protein